jgi:hypothetical protein
MSSRITASAKKLRSVETMEPPAREESIELAREILRKRQVRYVFAYEPERVVSNSEQILGEKSNGGTLAERLYKNSPPPWLEPLFQNRFFRVYPVAD